MKIKKLQGKLREKRVDLALFYSGEVEDPSTVYLSGLTNPQHSLLVVPAKGKAVFFANQLEYERAKAGSEVNVKLLKGRMSKIIEKNFPKAKKIGINGHWLPAAVYLQWKKKWQLIDISSMVEDVRLSKDAKEIRYLKKAAAIADKAFSLMLKDFTYKTEAEVAAALEYHMKRQGSSTAFPTIVASGKNASKPHHITSTQKLRRGFCVIDFGAMYKNYRSDMTRTLFLGKPTDKEKDLYNRLLAAQKAGVKAGKVGVSCKEVDNASRKHLGKLAKYFIHSLGHGVGVEVHEAPHIGPKSKEKLSRGMVFTVEPGIYVPGKYGIRIEDMVVLGKKKEVITKTSKQLIIIPKSL